jgi:ubiquitin-conjugating enzyme E2 W
MPNCRTFLAVVHLFGFLSCSSFARLPHDSVGFVARSTPLPLHLRPTTYPSQTAVLLCRGGDIDLVEDDGASFALTKLRNIIRGILTISDKKVKPLSTFLRGVLKSIESIIGIKLLPDQKAQKAQKAKVSKKKKARTSTNSTKQQRPTAKKGSDDTQVIPSQAKTSAATNKHLSSKIKSTNANYRIQRELKEFIKSPPPNLVVKVGSNIRVWIITMEGAKNSIYEGEVFKLRVSFPAQYPTVPPSVYFLQGYIPIHEHVYTNGDICLSLLGKDWRPTMTAQSIAVSILSILSSAQSKSLPMDNARHAGNKPGEYQKDWVYHDDNC